MSTPTFVDVQYGVGNIQPTSGGGSVSWTVPSDALGGDLCIAQLFLHHNNRVATTITPPDDWTLLVLDQNFSSGSPHFEVPTALIYRTLDASDPGTTVTALVGVSGPVIANCIVYRTAVMGPFTSVVSVLTWPTSAPAVAFNTTLNNQVPLYFAAAQGSQPAGGGGTMRSSVSSTVVSPMSMAIFEGALIAAAGTAVPVVPFGWSGSPGEGAIYVVLMSSALSYVNNPSTTQTQTPSLIVNTKKSFTVGAASQTQTPTLAVGHQKSILLSTVQVQIPFSKLRQGFAPTRQTQVATLSMHIGRAIRLTTTQAQVATLPSIVNSRIHFKTISITQTQNVSLSFIRFQSPLPPAKTITTPVPPDNILAAITGAAVRRRSRVEIYQKDGVTPYDLFPAISEASQSTISVDNSRDERRTLDLYMSDVNGTLKHYPGGFWYDKVIKCFSGAYGYDGSYWEIQVGEYVIDTIESDRYPKTVHVTGRDYTKRLKQSEFTQATNIQAGNSLETVIGALAANSGITKIALPQTFVTLASDFLFEMNTNRFSAMTLIANAYNYEVYFNLQGFLTMRTFRDPSKTPSVWTFKQGTGGTLSDWQKISSDVNVFNHIGVTGQRSDQLPVFAEAVNDNPASPTSRITLGDRYYPINNPYISTNAQAQALANSQLAILGLESFEIDMTSIVIPWLDANDVITFTDPSPAPGDPTSFLLTSFSLPLNLGTMNPIAKRVTVVG